MFNWLSNRFRCRVDPGDLGAIQLALSTLGDAYAEQQKQLNRIERKVYRDNANDNGDDLKLAEAGKQADVFDFANLQAGDQIPPGIDV